MTCRPAGTPRREDLKTVRDARRTRTESAALRVSVTVSESRPRRRLARRRETASARALGLDFEAPAVGPPPPATATGEVVSAVLVSSITDVPLAFPSAGEPESWNVARPR